MTLALAYDIDAIAQGGPASPPTGRSGCRTTAAPYTSTIVFLVRKGNPKGIKDWGDLVQPGVVGRSRRTRRPRAARAGTTSRRGAGRCASRAATRRKARGLRRRSSSRTCRCSTPARAARRRPSSSAASATSCSPGRTRRCLAVEGARDGQVRDRRAVARASSPSRRSRSSTRSSTSKGTRDVAAGLPRVPLHAGGAGDRGEALLPPARRRRARRGTGDVPGARSSFTDRRGVRRLGEGAEDRTSPTAASSTRSTSVGRADRLKAERRPMARPCDSNDAQRAARLRPDARASRCSTSASSSLIPLAALVLQGARRSAGTRFWQTRRRRRASLASYRLDASARRSSAALVNARLRPPRRLGARALPLPGPARSSTRSSTCRSRCRPRSRASR